MDFSAPMRRFGELPVLDGHHLDTLDPSPVQNDAQAFVADAVITSVPQNHVEVINALGLYSAVA